MAEVKEFVVKSREQIRDDYTRTIKAGLEDLGFTNVNVSKGTKDYLVGDAIGAFGEEIGNLVQLKANAQMPDTAGTNDPEDLYRLARIPGLGLRPAGPSIGPIIVSTTTGVPIGIPSGSQLLSSSGLLYETTDPGPFLDGDIIEVLSVDTGKDTELEAGSTLKWVSTPPFVEQTATVGTGGIVGGVDQENLEGLRERLLDYYAHPPGGGNWSQVALVAEQSSTFVKKAFVYPGVYGGNTMHVAVTAAPTGSNKSRVIPSSVVETVIKPAVVGEFPTFADIVVTSVDNFVVNITFAMDIPTSKKASPPGAGGGWIDADPWPRAVTGLGFAHIISVTSAVQFVVRGEGIPIVGTSISYLSPANFKLYSATVTSASQPDPFGFPLDWEVTVDFGFYLNNVTNTPIAVGEWVFPTAENTSTYIDALFDAFAEMGPAEKTTTPGLIPRSLRKPSTSEKAPSQVNATLLRALVLSSDEVLDTAFLTAVPTVPVNPGYQLAPFCAVPGKLALYPKV